MEQAIFDEVMDENVLGKLLSSFSKSTGLKAIFVDTEGNTLSTNENTPNDCRFCQMIRADAKGAQKCKKSYARAGREAAKYGEPYIFRCHAGLIAWAAPVLLEEHVGSIICGQVLMWEPEDYFLCEIEEMVSGLDVDVAAAKWAAAQLDVMSSDRVQAAADMLFVVANQIMQSGLTVLEQRREIAAHQARLAEEIRARKRAEIAVLSLDNRSLRVYSLDKEYELQSLVRSGDVEEAQLVLENLMADIIAKHTVDLDTVKIRVVELLVIISRAAAEGGANINEVLQLNKTFFLQLLGKNNVSDICLWTRGMLEVYMQRVGDSDQKNMQSIQTVANYIKEHYQSKLTIDEMAQVVYLSPCYLSRIFKQSVGCTLMEYVTQIRLEHAKKMLKDPKYNVMQVAEESGFEDPGYFAKVFKKIEGITPSTFRRNTL